MGDKCSSLVSNQRCYLGAPAYVLEDPRILSASPGTYAALTAFNAGAAGAKNIQTLLVMRFFAGAFGSSPLTNSGGVIADMFYPSQRGLALSVFAAAPFMG